MAEEMAFLEEQCGAITCDDLVHDEVLIGPPEVIGEAAKNLPPPFREAHPEVPWKAMAGMRDRLIHAYLGGRSVRDVITHEIPAQKPLVHALLDICDA